jgi:hypothetical protein
MHVIPVVFNTNITIKLSLYTKHLYIRLLKSYMFLLYETIIRLHVSEM